MDPRHPETAHKIVAEYAGLLQVQAEREVYPALLSDLPYPKDTIKTAIQTSVAALAETDQLTGELRDFLEVAYISLADYVDEELARLLRDYRRASDMLARDDRHTRERTGSPAWNVLAETGRLAATIARGIALETEQLRREFRALDSSAHSS